jgi:hypothetical protein
MPDRRALVEVMSEEPTVLTVGNEIDVVKVSNSLYSVPAEFLAKDFT